MMAQRAARLQRKLVRAAGEPGLVLDKLGAYLARRRKARLDLVRERQASLAFLGAHFGADADAVLTEYRRSEFRTWYQQQKVALAEVAGEQMTSSDFDLETIYLLVRLARPMTVVETGVLYGATSAHILEALRCNGLGHLHSIDLPRADKSLPTDFLIPTALRQRWELTLGDSRQELPRLLGRLGTIDHFHHDSLHTYQHMWWEYETAFGAFAGAGVLTSHDVMVGLLKRPFDDFCRRQRLAHGTFRNVGIAVGG